MRTLNERQIALCVLQISIFFVLEWFKNHIKVYTQESIQGIEF